MRLGGKGREDPFARETGIYIKCREYDRHQSARPNLSPISYCLY